MQKLLLSPPVALGVFLLLAYGIYQLSGVLSAPGEEHQGKHQPYACGVDLISPKVQLTYRAFFWLALMFGILHLATLVVSTLPLGVTSHRIAAAYVVGIGVSVFVLTKGIL